MVRVLVVDDVHPRLFELLTKPDFDVEYRAEIEATEVSGALSGIQVLVVRSKVQVNEPLLNKADALEVVARVGAGTDNVDEHYLAKRGITLLNAPEGNSDSVAEHTVGLLLTVLHRIATSHRAVQEWKWSREEARGTEIKGKTVGIIGYGHMGKAFARRLTGFECDVLFYDKNPSLTSDSYATRCSMETLLVESNIISLHIPLSPENRNFVKESFFAMMQKPVVLLNTSRGEIIESDALRKAIETGKVRGLGLDVLPNEKLHTLTSREREWFEWLISRDDVVITPHVAGWSIESYERLSVVIAQKLLAWYQNQ